LLFYHFAILPFCYFTILLFYHFAILPFSLKFVPEFKMTDMLDAFLWGLLGSISLTVGGLIGILFKIGRRPLGLIMAFGAGVLISAVAYELIFEAVKRSTFSGVPLLGLLVGAATFFLIDLLINRLGAQGRKDITGNLKPNLVIPIVLATILDGVPESAVIGMGLIGGSKVGLGMLVAVFISNLPEAVAGTSGMVAGAWNRSRILLLWFVISIVCAFASLAGYGLLINATHYTISFIQTFAAGAILVMLCNTMIPEAYEHGGKLAGIFTVLGFAVAVSLALLERAGSN
jgi:ZIP family zinc transporter